MTLNVPLLIVTAVPMTPLTLSVAPVAASVPGPVTVLPVSRVRVPPLNASVVPASTA
jgi:hypothetical protein